MKIKVRVFWDVALCSMVDENNLEVMLPASSGMKCVVKEMYLTYCCLSTEVLDV